MTHTSGGTDGSPTVTPTAHDLPPAAVGRRAMIGVDDVELPYWAQVDQQVVSASTWRMVSAVPRVVTGVTRRAWRAARGWTLAAALLELASGAATAFGLLSTAQVFTSLLAAGPTPQRVLDALPALALVVAAYAVRGMLDSATGLAQANLAPLVERQAQDELYAAVVDVELVAHDDPDFTELVQRASSMGLTRLRMATEGAADLVASLVSMAAAVVTAGLLHPLLAAAVLLTVLPQGWASVRVAKINYSSFVRSSSRQRRLGVIADLITSRANAAEVRAFTTGPMLLDELRHTADSLTAEAVTVARRGTVVRLAGRTLSGSGTGVAYGILGVLLYTGQMPLALAGAAALALRTAGSAVTNSAFSANRLYESSFYLDLLSRCRTDSLARARPPATTSLPAGAPTVIQVEHVGFTYPGQAHPAVEDICLTLRAGQTIALVGENGSGKSTLAKLLTGLYAADTGAVRWDGVDIAEAAAHDLHQRVAVVMQDPTEWPMTAADNIRVGRLDRPDPDGAHLRDCAARAGADSVVTALPDGWDTMLSRSFQTGRDLSGGQWQRISVARGLYRDAALVVADEPTAAMDARAEHLVFKRLHELSKPCGEGEQQETAPTRKITVLITHRLANVRHAHLIAVMHNGRITETGSHEQLLTAGGAYAELFALQSAAYYDDSSPGVKSDQQNN